VPHTEFIEMRFSLSLRLICTIILYTFCISVRRQLGHYSVFCRQYSYTRCSQNSATVWVVYRWRNPRQGLSFACLYLERYVYL